MSEDHPQQARVERWVDLPARAEEVWEAVGGFGAIAEWHPAISDCDLVEIEGELHRHLTLSDGEMVLERLIETDDHLYRYEMVETPLPVDNYHATLTCFDRKEGGCRVFWSGVFDPLDVRAHELIGGIYQLGLEEIRARFGG